jgi:hypothetical protein
MKSRFSSLMYVFCHCDFDSDVNDIGRDEPSHDFWFPIQFFAHTCLPFFSFCSRIRSSFHKQIFGIAPWYTWPLPVDPIFDDYDRVVGFTMPQRLDRERQFCEAKRPLPDIRTAQSLELPRCVNDLLPV